MFVKYYINFPIYFIWWTMFEPNIKYQKFVEDKFSYTCMINVNK